MNSILSTLLLKSSKLVQRRKESHGLADDIQNIALVDSGPMARQMSDSASSSTKHVITVVCK